MARGHFVRPVLVTDVSDDAPLVAGEQFGPVVPLLAYDDEDEVVARANAGDLGLGASVWSADEDRAFAFARRFDAGFTFVNTHNRTGMALRAPFGGVKRSGHGREYGTEACWSTRRRARSTPRRVPRGRRRDGRGRLSLLTPLPYRPPACLIGLPYWKHCFSQRNSVVSSEAACAPYVPSGPWPRAAPPPSP